MHVLPGPARLSLPWCLTLLLLDDSTARWCQAGTAADVGYRAKGKYRDSRDLAWEQQDDKVFSDCAGGMVEFEVQPGSLSLPQR